ncbi:MAG: hypothetical protein COA57_13700 [Flavobacteriales bacterium]|nr:MAG: hypothetical protein COA57_13700 [Flavobacteriales bacterium]
MTFLFLLAFCTKVKIDVPIKDDSDPNGNNTSDTTDSTVNAILDTCIALNVTFSEDIQPIFVYTCCECHAWCKNYNGIIGWIPSGKMDTVLFIEKSMPPTYATGPKFLTDQELLKIQCWIDAGYPNN